MSKYWEVIFDVETKKLFGDDGAFEPGQLGVSIASAYRRGLDENFRETSGEMKSFWEGDFPQLWEWFEGADRIIGFNTIGFDVPALEPYYQKGLSKLPHFDILAKVKERLGHRLSLDALAKETLGHTKIDNGLNAVKYWASGDQASLDKLKKYCEMDVVVTRDLYDHGLHHKLFKFKDKWNELRTVEVDFAYPPEEKPEEIAQMGLF